MLINTEEAVKNVSQLSRAISEPRSKIERIERRGYRYDFKFRTLFLFHLSLLNCLCHLIPIGQSWDDTNFLRFFLNVRVQLIVNYLLHQNTLLY